MNKPEFLNALELAHKEKKISPFVYQFILKKAHTINSEDILGDVIQDAFMMGNIVQNAEDLQRYIGAQNIIPFFSDKLKIRLTDEDIGAICRGVVEQQINEMKNVGELVFKYIDQKRKRAYPMVRYWGAPILKKQNMEEWINKLSFINRDVARGIDRHKAIDHYTSDMSSYEKGMFEQWVKYYEDGDYMKYSENRIEKRANIEDPSYLQMLNDAFNARQTQEAKDKEVRERRQEATQKRKMLKKKMRSRLRSLYKLLDAYIEEMESDDTQYQDDGALGDIAKDDSKTQKFVENMKKIKDSLQNLSFNIDSHVASYSVDGIYKTANMAKETGFKKFADKLIKVAQEFEGAAKDVDRVATEPSVNLAGMKKEFDGEESLAQVKKNSDPLKILQKLEGLSKFLKERSLIRELSEVDIMMSELQMQSYFPELAEAQAKLIDAFSYASSKIESSIAKMRGGLEEKEKAMQPIPEEPSKDLEASPPTGEVKVRKGEPPTGV